MKSPSRSVRSETGSRQVEGGTQRGPGLVTILVGENPASVSYVTGKQKTSKELGFYSIQDNQPENVTEEGLLKLIDQYNRTPRFMGFSFSFLFPSTSTNRGS